MLKSGGPTVVLPKAEGLLVPLPVAPPHVQFLEVGVELEVAGAVEASRELNDRLDVRAFRVIEVKLEDTDGKPVPGERFEVRGSRRQRVRGQLNDKGEARVLGLSGTHCQVIFPNLQPEIVALDTEDDDEEPPAAEEETPSPGAVATSGVPEAADRAVGPDETSELEDEASA
ncbi:MAG: hypothetical protein K0R38_6708 [Polyangiaceae bacterium]|jgi:hypothetical protein|nr:hypothetical protein [Polyangiaceae bacterium]